MSRKSMIKPYKHCKKCGAFIVSGDLCEDCKPITNGDRIRKMTDEELADKLTDKCAVCAYHYAECETKFCICEEGVLKWLKQEVSEDAGTDD